MSTPTLQLTAQTLQQLCALFKAPQNYKVYASSSVNPDELTVHVDPDCIKDSTQRRFNGDELTKFMSSNDVWPCRSCINGFEGPWNSFGYEQLSVLEDIVWVVDRTNECVESISSDVLTEEAWYIWANFNWFVLVVYPALKDLAQTYGLTLSEPLEEVKQRAEKYLKTRMFDEVAKQALTHYKVGSSEVVKFKDSSCVTYVWVVVPLYVDGEERVKKWGTSARALLNPYLGHLAYQADKIVPAPDVLSHVDGTKGTSWATSMLYSQTVLLRVEVNVADKENEELLALDGTLDPHEVVAVLRNWRTNDYKDLVALSKAFNYATN